MNLFTSTPLAQVAPAGAPSNVELLLVSIVPTVVGLLLFWFGIKAEESGAAKFIKWIALVPLLVGLFIGYGYWQQVTGDLGDFYRANYLINRKVVFFHLAFYLPIVGLVGLGVWTFLLKRKGERAPTEEEVYEEEYFEEEEYVDEEPLEEVDEEVYVEDETPEDEPPAKP
ncbi:MAG TPA: hypothetical protein PLH94_09605 [Fimbriimonadaceae bacterium]|nr:hypothetical protein [Fimbriimonadaceae bacterium]